MKLICNELHSDFAFYLNVRRYKKVTLQNYKKEEDTFGDCAVM
jgi:hypothetical protein